MGESFHYCNAGHVVSCGFEKHYYIVYDSYCWNVSIIQWNLMHHDGHLWDRVSTIYIVSL